MDDSLLIEIGREHLRLLCEAVEETVGSYIRVGYDEAGELVPAERRRTFAETLGLVSEHLLALRTEVEELDAATHRSVSAGTTDQRES